VTGHRYQFRAPWYARERSQAGVFDARSRRPVLQKYDSTRFVQQVITDPRDSLAFTVDDVWSYPVPVAFPAPGRGRQKFATSCLVRTQLRKLFQPGHDRFYLVVVELFCDQPGLPQAGSHRDVDVEFVLRRRQTTVKGNGSDVRKLARDLLVTTMRTQCKGVKVPLPIDGSTSDVADVWWADAAARERFAQDNGDVLTTAEAELSEHGWLVDSTDGTGRWAPPATQTQTLTEERHPMWRVPDEAFGCDTARSRSLWFGVVPTYSAEHWRPDPHGRPEPKLDEHAIYQIRTVVTPRPAEGHEHCPRTSDFSFPSEPFRLAAPYDPDGTKNHRTSISVPDFRTLAAKAGQGPGPGGLAINTPPGSQMRFNPFGGVPKPGAGSMGNGGVCTFAFELFFIVALFLFLMFLPIVVFVFQLWWMLALRFCFPRLQVQMDVLADFFADAHVDILAEAKADVQVRVAFDAVFGVTVKSGSTDPGIVDSLAASPQFANPAAAADLLDDLVSAVDPQTVPEPPPVPVEPKPADPLCPVP
jgi:hypothetical protein